MIEYSPRAQIGKSFLKDKHNDINIFVEDSGNTKLWKYLINKLILPKRVEDIFPLGGRKAVIDECQKNRGVASSKPNLFIIDGDYDYLLGKPKPFMANLYRLNCYCVENLLFNKEAIIGVAESHHRHENGNDLYEEIMRYINLSNISSSLIRLSRLYAVCEYVQLGEQTQSYNIDNFKLSNKDKRLCIKKINDRKKFLYKLVVKKVGIVEFNKVYKNICRQSIKHGIDATVSGKTFLLPLLHFSLIKKTEYKCNNEILKVHLAEKIPEDFEPNLKQFLTR